MNIALRGWSLAVCVFLITGCSESSKGGTGDLVEQVIALTQELDELECDCDPDACPIEMYSSAEVACFKGVFAGDAERAEPELRCVARSLAAERDCFAQANCADITAWEACYDVGEHCEDTVRDSHDGELEACADENDQD